MYFSFRGERKVPKESPRKERTQVLSLRILSPFLQEYGEEVGSDIGLYLSEYGQMICGDGAVEMLGGM